MAEYPVNKGIGRPVEFKGLKAQYLFVFAVGLGVTAASAVVWLTFRLNAKYGQHGLMKLGAARMRPRYLLHRRRVSHLLRRKRKGRKE